MCVKTVPQVLQAFLNRETANTAIGNNCSRGSLTATTDTTGSVLHCLWSYYSPLAVLFNRQVIINKRLEGYSMTTQKHINQLSVLCSRSGIDCLFIPFPDNTPGKGFADIRSQIGDGVSRFPTVGEFSTLWGEWSPIDYELIDHGIDNHQYFLGCGTTFTRFEHVSTGCGNNPAEAIEDCLESIAQMGLKINLEVFGQQIKTDNHWSHFPLRPAVSVKSEDCYYYVSIRFNVKG